MECLCFDIVVVQCHTVMSAYVRIVAETEIPTISADDMGANV